MWQWLALLILGSLASIAHLATCLFSRQWARKPERESSPLPPITLLKPLKGVDPGLAENLRSFFVLDYPGYELRFCLESPQDPALLVLNAIRAQHPAVDCHVHFLKDHARTPDAGESNSHSALNPKIENITAAYHQARYDWILISDSNVFVRPDYLKEMASQMKSDTGMVTSLVQAECDTASRRYLGSRLEAIFLNTFYNRGMIAAFRAKVPTVMGKSMLFSRQEAARFGGLKTLGIYLAEDFMAGEAMRYLGLRIRLAPSPVFQRIGKLTLPEFWLRHIRWGRIRKAQAPLFFHIEPILALSLGVALASLALSRLLSATEISIHPMLLAGALWAFHFVGEALHLRAQGIKPKFADFPLWLLRELTHPILWLHIRLGNHVNWRGRRIQLSSDGRISVESPSASIGLTASRLPVP